MIISWIMDKLGITSLRIQVAEQRLLIHKLTDDLEKLTSEIHAMDKVDIDVDCYNRGRNTIILTGCYKGKGYVKFYDLPQGEFIQYVQRMEYEKKHHLLRNVDCPLAIRAWFNFEDY